MSDVFVKTNTTKKWALVLAVAALQSCHHVLYSACVERVPLRKYMFVEGQLKSINWSLVHILIELQEQLGRNNLS